MSSTRNHTKLSADAARKTVLEKLKNLSPELREQLSQQICRRTIEALDGQGIKSIALYRPLRSEVNLSLLESHFHKTGARLCYPRVMGTSDFCHVPSPSDAASWLRSSLGIEEPAAHHETVNADSIDCIVIPGLAFGLHGERVGRGKGHYDRLLAGVSHPLRVVLAFDFQLFDALEQNAWDQPVHWIMTEKRELKLR
jgi:5-formyltetrahydrofolate cyclo-ligase